MGWGEELRAAADNGEKPREDGVKETNKRSPAHFQYRNSPAAEARALLEAYTTG